MSSKQAILTGVMQVQVCEWNQAMRQYVPTGKLLEVIDQQMANTTVVIQESGEGNWVIVSRDRLPNAES